MGQRIRILILLVVLSGIGIGLGSLFGTRETNDSDITSLYPRPPGVPGVRVRVEVLNGSGVAGIAWDATQLLRGKGFDVVSFGNAETYSADSSVVMDRVGTMETARSVAEALGIARVRSEPDSTLFVDVTVLLGPDWTGPGSEHRAAGRDSHWWNLRRLWRGDKDAIPPTPIGP
jgi:hypothetical protein